MSGLDTTAGTRVSLSPVWERPLSWLPALSVYLLEAPVDGDSCLCLDARAPGLPAEAVREVVVEACDYLAEGRPFPELLLVEEPVELESLAEPVDGPDALAARLGLVPRRLDDDPLAIVTHARWVKRLCDQLQTKIDRALLRAAERPAIAGEPLVCVRIPTYGDTDLLIERALPSVLNGTYRNLEVLVCSDGPQPHARAAVGRVADPRVRYLELGERPRYPRRGTSFWQTAGTYAVNHMLDAANADFIAPLDHDDAFTATHVEDLLGALAGETADFAFGQAITELPDGTWTPVGSLPLRHGHVVHGSVLYSRRLGHMRHDPLAWLVDEPGDWNLWRRMMEAGARVAHAPAPVVIHFKEGSSREGRPADPTTVLDDWAHDVLETEAGALLAVASAARGARIDAARPRRTAPARRPPAHRRLAILDTTFPLRLSGFRWQEAQAMLRLRPDTVVFALAPTAEHWPRPVYPLALFDRLAGELGITDAYAVFLNLTVGLLDLGGHPAAAQVGGVPRGASVARALRRDGIRLHATLYPGGGLVRQSPPAILRAVAERCATVFTNAREVVDAVPEARELPGPIATDFYAFRPRERRSPFRVVFAAADRPRKGLDTVIAAFRTLGEDVHLHVVGPHARHLGALRPGAFTFHGWLEPEELRGLYWACDAFVSPVRVEGADGTPGEEGVIDGFPTAAAADALATGCALISSNPRDDRSVLTPGEHYVEIPERDPAALAAAVETLAADRDGRDELAARGAARVAELMDVGRIAQAKLAAMGV